MKNIISLIKETLFSSSSKVNDIPELVVSNFLNKKELEVPEIIAEKEILENEIFEDYQIEKGWDKVFYATFSDNLNRMLSVTELDTTPKNRHHLLQCIVAHTYKLRNKEKYKNICLEFAEKHLQEFSVIAPNLINKYNTALPRVSTFQNYSTLLTEIGEYEKAIKVCQMAISFGLEDGTKGGYQSRIDRINKKKSEK